MKARSIIFDLDGTLVDSLDDITASLNHVLAARDLPLEQLEVVRPNLETLYLNLTGRGLRE